MDAALLLTIGLLLAPADTTIPSPSIGAMTDSCEAAKDPAATAVCLNHRALDQEQHGDYASASRTLEEADQLWTADLKPSAALHATILSNLGDTYEQLGHWREARESFMQALAENEKAFGRSDVHAAFSMVRVASVEIVLGNPARADELLNAALPIERRAMPGSAMEFSGALSIASMFELQRGNIAEAAKLAQEGVAASGSRGEDTVEYAANLTNLAGVYIVEHDTARATPLLNRSIDILERRLGPEHPRLTPVLMDRAMIYQGEGKSALAEADATRAVAILARESGSDNINTVWARLRLASIYLDEGKLSETEGILPAVVERHRKFYDHPNWRVAASVGELARLRATQSRSSEADSLYRESLAMFEAAAPHNPEAARAMRGYADLLRAEGGPKREIRKLMAKAKAISSETEPLSR
jgi:tetratricopeptide (TPR) repeat protein